MEQFHQNISDVRHLVDGGFQLEHGSISLVIGHMTCYKFECSHWWIFFFKSFIRFALQSEFNQSTQIITGHVIYNPAYTYKFQLKTTHDMKINIKRDSYVYTLFIFEYILGYILM